MVKKNNPVLWQPSKSQIESSQMTEFANFVNQKYTLNIQNYDQLYDWSIGEVESFWDAVWEFCQVISAAKGEKILNKSGVMEGAHFFPQATLNFAENLLSIGQDFDDALVFVSENGKIQRLNYAQLRSQVAATAKFLKASGVVKGDCVAGYLPNMNETVIVMLATTSLGAIWSSCSPDFGVLGVLERFSQIKPKIIFVTDAYTYGGKVFSVMEKNKAVIKKLSSLVRVVLVPLLDENIKIRSSWLKFSQLLSDFQTPTINYVNVGFNDPLYIMFSSGTTGMPKCIVHGVGGTLLQHLKEHRLHVGLRASDTIFYATTCGWMMWNWLVSGLATGSRIILYDGSLFYPDPQRLFDLIDEESISIFGISAKFIDVLSKKQLSPRNTHDLSSLRTILSTGSPLVSEAFDYVYEHIKQNVCLSSISGGTDIISCFILGAEVLPVRRGELQCRGLGMAVEAWSEDGVPVIEQKGELVCVKPFPSMPVKFWNDADNQKYHAAYFNRFSNVWCHGDFIDISSIGGVQIFGRSDAVLNRGGIRIGTAEIYRQVEQLPEVNEALAIGLPWQGDVRLVLFVRLENDLMLDDLLRQKVCDQLRRNATVRHVPDVLIAVPEIPKTRSGKITELAVRDVVMGKVIKNKEALMNPDSLNFFKNLPELKA